MRALDPADWAGRDVLLVAPHPDDEAIGAGGTVHLAARSGARVLPVICTRGDGGIGADGVTASDREAESRRACSILGIREPCFLGLPSPQLREEPAAAAEALAAAAGTNAFDVVLVPSPLERHDTHRASFLAAAWSGAARAGADWWAWGVWDTIPAEDDVVEVDVTAGRSAKTGAVAAHGSQNGPRALAAGIAARDMAQAVFSRITGNEPRKAVERLLPLGDLAERLVALGRGHGEAGAVVREWVEERASAWARRLWDDAGRGRGS